jgi:glycosyltransferase involved in cell wall biosynthesis
MTVPSIDIILTHCNLNDYLDAAVKSALDQDGLSTRVIVVDDASDTVPQYGDWPVDRVVLIRRDVRGGHAAALNTGLAHSRAALVSFLDADDLLPAHRCQVLVHGLVDRNADIAFGGQVVFNDGDHPVLRLDQAQRDALPPVQPGVLTGTVLTTRALVDRAGPFDEAQPFGSFIEWMGRVRQLEPPVVEAAVGEVVLLRRSHAANMTRTKRDDFSAYLHLAAQHRARGRA